MGCSWPSASALRLADVVISTNESFRQIAIERGRKRPRTSSSCGTARTRTVFRPVARRSGPSARGDIISSATSVVMGRQDGVLEALHALAALRRRRTDWRAVFVGDGRRRRGGENGSRAAWARRRASTFVGLRLGPAQQLVQLIATCDVCLSPEPPNELNAAIDADQSGRVHGRRKARRGIRPAETRVTAGGRCGVLRRSPSPTAYADEIDALLDDPDAAGDGRARTASRPGGVGLDALEDPSARCVRAGDEPCGRQARPLLARAAGGLRRAPWSSSAWGARHSSAPASRPRPIGRRVPVDVAARSQVPALLGWRSIDGGARDHVVVAGVGVHVRVAIDESVGLAAARALRVSRANVDVVRVADRTSSPATSAA